MNPPGYSTPSSGSGSYPTAVGHAAEARGHLVVVRGTGVGRSFALRDETLIGRGSESDILLPGQGISRRHARIGRTPAGKYVLHDLGSMNGTRVNEKPVQEQGLKSGDRIGLGNSTVLMFLRSRSGDQELRSGLARMMGGPIHELHNLMGALLSGVSLLRDLPGSLTLEDGDVQERHRDLEFALRRAARLTRSILRIASSGSGPQRQVDIRQVLAATTALLESTPSSISVTLESEKDLWVIGDEALLRVLLSSLCLSAREAMSEGQLQISGRPRQLLPGEARELSMLPGEYVCITLRCRSCKTTSGQPSAMFQPLLEVDEESPSPKLGLATAYEIVKDHGGTLQLGGENGRVSNVTIYLPAGDLPTAPSQSGAPLDRIKTTPG